MSVERVSTGARTSGLRVVNRETNLSDGVLKVNRSPCQVRHRHLVNDDFNAVIAVYSVAIKHTFVKVQLVDQTRTSTRLYSDTQAQIRTAFLFQEVANFGGSHTGQHDLVRWQSFSGSRLWQLVGNIICLGHRVLL